MSIMARFLPSAGILGLVSIASAIAVDSLPKQAPQPQVSVRRVPNGGIQPQAVTDSTGVVHLLYYSGNPAHGDLYYVTSADAGLTWSVPMRVNSQPETAIALGTIRGGQIAIGKNRRVHVAWNGSSKAEPHGRHDTETTQADAPMLYARLNNAHTAFEPERNLMMKTFGLDGGGTVAADMNGHVYVGWHGKDRGARSGESGRQVWIAISSDEGKTFSQERAAIDQPTGACGCCGMAMHSDSRGVVRTLYRSATEDVHRDIYLLTSGNRAQSFSNRKLDTWNINACPMSSMAFAERADEVAGAWETGGQVYFEKLTDRDAKPISAPGPSKSHKHPRLAIGPNGETLLVWTEGTSWNKGGTIAWQLYDGAGRSGGETGNASGLSAWSFAAATATPKGFLVVY